MSRWSRQPRAGEGLAGIYRACAGGIAGSSIGVSIAGLSVFNGLSCLGLYRVGPLKMAISDGDRHEAYLRRLQQPVLDIESVLAVLRRRAVFVAGVTLACAALSLVYVLLVTPKYVASGRILLDARASQVGVAASREALDTNSIENEIKAITSRDLLRKVVLRERLETDPLFGAKPKGILSSLLAGIGLVPAADPQVMALRQLERAVSVTRDPGSSVVNVNAVAPDRDISARVANAVMESYIADVARMPLEAAPRASEPADTSLEMLQERLRDAEQNYQKYRQDNGVVGTNGQPLIEQQISDLSGQISSAEAKVGRLRSELSQIQRVRNDRDYGAVPDTLRSRTFDTLKNRYTAARRVEADLAETLGPKHPDLKLARMDLAEARRLLDQAVADMVQSTTGELERARSAGTGLKARREALQKELVKSSEMSARLAELERDVSTNRAAYQTFLLRSRNLNEPPQVDRSVPRILSRAVPPLERSGVSPIRVLLISLLLGFGLAISVAWLLELIEERNGKFALR